MELPMDDPTKPNMPQIARTTAISWRIAGAMMVSGRTSFAAWEWSGLIVRFPMA